MGVIFDTSVLIFMIASTAIALGFSVVTLDLRDYGKVKELTVVKFKNIEGM